MNTNLNHKILGHHFIVGLESTELTEKEKELLSKIEPFGIIYVDKDHRFIGKTNQSYDSLGALQRLEELKHFTGYCLDTTIWKWAPQLGNDTTTLFFTEEKQWIATSPEFTFSLAMDKVGTKTYNVNLYIKRRKK